MTVIAVSCDLFTGDDCGPFKNKFKTIDFNSDLKDISFSDVSGIDIQYSSLETDTISYRQFGIAMLPVVKYYSSNLKKSNSFPLIQSAFACSPVTPVSDEIITDIMIFSDKSFNSEYTSGDNLAKLFDVVVLYNSSGYERFDLNQFLNSEPNVPDEIFLLLKDAPENVEPMQFTIQYSQDGIDMDIFEFTTGSVIITK